MKIMLDNSPEQIKEKSLKFNHEFWQLRTPLTKYAINDSGRPYGLDNGCFARFKEHAWNRLLQEAEAKRPVFVCLPDIVGDARRTLDLFDMFERKTNGLPRALVLQDGIGQHAIPWNKIDAIFIGGTDEFKISPEAINAAKAARMLHKWIHVGRVNTVSRVNNWIDLADSIDGSGISRFDDRLQDVLTAIQRAHPQCAMDI